VHQDSKIKQAPPMRRAVGSAEKFVQLSDFNVEGQVGEGSFGRVYTATWKESGKAVAIKALKPKEDFRHAVPADELKEFYQTIHDSFKSEIKFLEIAGSHPNIVSCLGKSKDQKMAVVEIACCDLFQLVKASKKQLPLDICHNISGGLIAGVAHLHDHGIVHQDLKSSNILIDAHGRPKICDFGLAIALRKGQDVQVDRELVTLWYRPPELLLGTDRYTNQIDNWAVGCIILEMIVGGVAFPGDPTATCSCEHRRHLNFNTDQLTRVFKTVGTPEINPKKYHCAAHIAKWPRYPSRLDQVLADGLRRRGPASMRSGPSGLDCASVGAWTEVIEDLLNCDPEQRLTCGEALQFPFFRATHGPDAQRSRSPVPPATVSPGQKARPGTGCLKRTESSPPMPRSAEELLRQLTEKKEAPVMAAGKAKPDAGLGLKFPAIAAPIDPPQLDIGDMMGF